MKSDPAAEVASAKPKREPRRKVKNDPRLVAAARELRDRWLERVNADGFAEPVGKYDVARRIAGDSPRLPRAVDAVAALPAPAPLAA